MPCKKQKRRVEALLEEINAMADFIIEIQKRIIKRNDRWFARWEKEREENSRRFELHLKELSKESPEVNPVKEIRNDPIEKQPFEIC